MHVLLLNIHMNQGCIHCFQTNFFLLKPFLHKYYIGFLPYVVTSHYTFQVIYCIVSGFKTTIKYDYFLSLS